MPDRLRDRVLSIGGATGIAAATARMAKEEGASVLAIARHAGELENSASFLACALPMALPAP